MDVDTRAYFTAATMMDEKRTIPTLFCTLHLATSYLFLQLKKLTFLALVGKYNYSLLDRALLVKVNSLGNKFYTLVEFTRTYKNISLLFYPLHMSYFFRGRLICVMLHLVNYSHIALSLGVKVKREIMKIAGYGATSLFGQPNNKVYSNKYASISAGQGYVGRVSFSNSRAIATFNGGVMAEVIKKEYKRVLQRAYSNCKGAKHGLEFSQEWEQLESNLIKDINENKWPRLTTKANQLLKLLQIEICQLSLIGSNKKAMDLIDLYSMNIVIRYIAINKITAQSGSTPGIDNFIIKNNSHKLELLSQSKKINLNSRSTMKVKLVKIPKPDGTMRTLGISTMLDRVLQTQLCLLLDSFYEATYSEHTYGYRKGRNTHQAVGFLKAVLERSDTKYAGLILFDIEKCFHNISHEMILTYFIVPKKWKPFLIKWLEAKLVTKTNISSPKLKQGIIPGSVIAPMICNVIVNEALLKDIKGSAKLAIFKKFKATSSVLNETTSKKSQRNVYRNIIVYAGNIAITTTNSEEAYEILDAVIKSLSKFNLNISKEESLIINYSDGKRIEFKYLGFSFVYVPTKHIKKGGILTRYDDITKRKFSKTQNGTYLVYPNSEKFQDIKNKCKISIRLLLKASLVEVLNRINAVVRRWANYYAWSNSYNRLKTLDGLLIRYLKKYLIRKFRNRGVRKPVWVAKQFFVCKTTSNSTGRFTSPYNLRWHPHTKLVNNKDNSKRFKNVLFLVMPSKVSKIVPISSAILSKDLRAKPYYLVEDKFANNSAALYSKRINTDNYKEKLFIKQKGMCPHCKSALANSDKSDFSFDIFGNDLEIHHKREIAEMQIISKSAHKGANFFGNLVLLHKMCHLEIHLG
jgi:RNA-directed DNA polymerase